MHHEIELSWSCLEAEWVKGTTYPTIFVYYKEQHNQWRDYRRYYAYTSKLFMLNVDRFACAVNKGTLHVSLSWYFDSTYHDLNAVKHCCS